MKVIDRMIYAGAHGEMAGAPEDDVDARRSRLALTGVTRGPRTLSRIAPSSVVEARSQ